MSALLTDTDTPATHLRMADAALHVALQEIAALRVNHDADAHRARNTAACMIMDAIDQVEGLAEYLATTP
jgi:hypothetical protein